MNRLPQTFKRWGEVSKGRTRVDDFRKKVSRPLHEFCYQLSAEVLLKKIAQSHADTDVSDLQMEILAQVNNLGIGTLGWGAIVRQRKSHPSLT